LLEKSAMKSSRNNNALASLLAFAIFSNSINRKKKTPKQNKQEQN